MSGTEEKVHFATPGAFHADLRRRVEGWFERTGRSQKANGAMRLKTAAVLVWAAASWGLLIFAPLGPWLSALLAVSLGLAVAGIGFNVMHDANHGSYSDDPRVNGALAFTSDLMGASSWLWRQKHNVLHHTYANVVGMDPDVEAGTFLRLAPAQAVHAWHRFQHLYAWPLYGVFMVKWWFVDEIRDLVTGRIHGHRFPRPRGWDLSFLVLGKVLFLAWAVVIPVWVHPTWAILPFWLLAVGTLGITLASVFQLAHCVVDAEFVAATGGALPTDWAAHQVSATVDFARRSRFLSWYLGGLNFQVEHHLFPKICHVHYPALAPIVEATCRDHGVRYRAQPTLRGALAANVRWLWLMGGHGAPA
ncbi:MAG TPA: acyl-CoA desaturase [Anaeromyxobacteraceae bacterium]|nr:acyl-CoA desaturase [Anaeromyxobacteraceae bacterium]